MKKFIILSIVLLEVISALAQSCLPNGYNFGSQEAIDNFHTNFPNCTEIEGNVDIFSIGSHVTNLNGLSGVTRIGGWLQIYDNPDLASLAGLEDLKSIGDHLVIDNNDLLTNLTGLDSLTSIGTFISITKNESLTSLSGLGKIQAGSISMIYIYYNFSLSSCDVEAICNYLAIPSAPDGIYSNAPGCNERQEIINSCNSGLDNEIIPDFFLTLYPDPCSTSLTVRLPGNSNFRNTTFAIYNVNSQQVISQRLTEPQTVVDISTLPCGLYFVRVSNDGTVMTGKFVRQ